MVYYPQLHRRRILHCTGFFLFDLQEMQIKRKNKDATKKKQEEE
ncbi:hypothetical protein HMPREF0373_03151 [Eubacterium ramulus ATCC 29099]|uniref:Uncharacterized protein n=1 Tax=Eubacterium ramulus ATCC 29099 TaxID=1256908 RepID=U2PD72_EUBRA|nr:hypothetical protein HMPREF0373_03151 [Eubacterium ramulus ATCC 29099]